MSDDIEVKEEVVKCMDEMPMMLNDGPISFTELAKLEAMHEASEKLSEMSYQFPQMARRIFEREDIENKDDALQILANEFITFAQETLSKEKPKSLWTKLKEAAGFETKEEDTEDKAVWSTAMVNDLPDSSFLYIAPGGNKEDGKTVPRTLRYFPYKDASGKIDLPHLRNAIARIPQAKIPPEKKTSLQKRAQALLAEQNKENVSIWLNKDTGQYQWLASYSNNFRDDDNPAEIISTQSHKEFDAVLEKGEWPMPEAWLWHIPYPVGKTYYHTFDENTGFTVAGGVFDKGMEWAAEGIVKAGWTGVSHGMPKSEIERNEKDKTIITRHRTREISFLPPWAAANKYSFNIISKEIEMDNEVKGLPAHKRPEFLNAFGEDKVQEIENTIAQRAKEAEEEGRESKEATQPEVEEVKALSQDDLVKALSPVATAFENVLAKLEAFDTRLKELEKSDSDKITQKAANIPAASIEARIESLFNSNAQVDGRTTLAKQGPVQTDPKQGGGIFFEQWLGGGNVRQ